jgi:acetyl-CoA synthetase
MSDTEKNKAQEAALFHPSDSIVEQARMKDYESLYLESVTDREAFWSREAENLTW